MKVDNKVTYGLLTPEMLKCTVFFFLYFMHLNTIFLEGVRRFYPNLKRVHDRREVKTPCSTRYS